MGKRGVTELNDFELYARASMLLSDSKILMRLFEQGLEIGSYLSKEVSGVVNSTKRFYWVFKNKSCYGKSTLDDICDSILEELIIPIRNKEQQQKNISEIISNMNNKISNCKIVDAEGGWVAKWKFFEIKFIKIQNKYYFTANPASPIFKICPNEYSVLPHSKNLSIKKGFYSKNEALIFAKKIFRKLKKILII